MTITNPNYGTHDWIIHRAKNMLPPMSAPSLTATGMRFCLAQKRQTTPIWTTLAKTPATETSWNQEVYFNADGTVARDAAARRAQEEFNKASAHLPSNERLGAYYAGTLSHYVADVAVYSHVMGADSHRGNETLHFEYERGVNNQLLTYSGGVFGDDIHFDGELKEVSPYTETINLARGTDFGQGATKTPPGWTRTCRWLVILFP